MISIGSFYLNFRFLVCFVTFLNNCINLYAKNAHAKILEKIWWFEIWIP